MIGKKRDGLTLADSEIEHLVNAVSRNTIDHVQIGAMLMAIRLSGMTDEETVQLTRCMMTSGHVLHWPDEWQHLVVDKHSTGGVGDKTSLVLAPALAACGLKVPMVSGRGLGHTGGTLDKLESIPGFTVMKSADEIRAAVTEIGCCIVGQTSSLVPADAVMYSARDVTATIDSAPLITGSIVSKKAVEGLAALVLDVKIGKAALLTDETAARQLAQLLVTVSKRQGMETTALLTKMDSPVGNTIGHALEVAEAVECLHGNGPRPLVDLTARLGGYLLSDVGLASSPQDGAAKIETSLRDGRAMDKFRAMIESQGVDSSTAHALCKPTADVFRVLPAANYKTDVFAPITGHVVEIDAMACARVCGQMGGSRFKASDVIDPAVGLVIKRHVGCRVNEGDVVIVVHHNAPLANELVTTLQNAVSVQAEPLDSSKCSDLVLDVIK